MSSERNAGKWSEEEKLLFQQGIAEFGLDWRKMEECLGGRRSLSQIRQFYRTTKDREPHLFSPAKVEQKTPAKKRTSTDAGIIALSVPKKNKADKTNSSSATVKPIVENASVAASTSRVVYMESTSTVRPKDDRGLEEKEAVEVDDPPPPLSPSSIEASTKESVIATSPTAKMSLASTAISRDVLGREVEKEEPNTLSLASEILKKEEVQTILAGVLGFAVVYIAKKLCK